MRCLRAELTSKPAGAAASGRPVGPAGGMGRVQFFEIRLSHGRIVYSPGEPLAGAVHVCLRAPLPFRGGRGSPWDWPGWGGFRWLRSLLGLGRDSRKRRRCAKSGTPPSPLTRPRARRGASRLPRVMGVLGGRPAALGAEQGGLGGPGFRFCPSCSLRPVKAESLSTSAEPTETCTQASLRPSLPGLQGLLCQHLPGPDLEAGLSLPHTRLLAQTAPLPSLWVLSWTDGPRRHLLTSSLSLSLWTGGVLLILGAHGRTGICQVNLSPPGLTPCWCTHLGLWYQVATAGLPSTLHRCRPLLSKVSTGTWVGPQGGGGGSLALSTRL